MSEESQPGGLISGVRWKVVSPLNHDFLQATMMLCFALIKFNKESNGSSTKGTSALHRHNDILEALAVAKCFWEKEASRSTEARRASKAITTALKQDDGSDAFGDFTRDEQIPGVAMQQSYLNKFDYGQDIPLDPSLFTIDDDREVFGGIFGEFTTDASI